MKHALYHGADAYAWHARRWPQFAALDSPEATHIIIPIYSISDWAMGRPLDVEEVVGTHFLDTALQSLQGVFDSLVVAPLRFTPRQSPGSAFTLDIEVAHQLLIETVRSAADCGFRRFILFNTSPLLEEWVDVAARDLRIDFNLQLFAVNLSGIGLDFHPVRGGCRAVLQTILTNLLGECAEEVFPLTAQELDPIPDAVVATDSVASLDTVPAETLLPAVTARLTRLLREISEHDALLEHEPDARETE